MRTSNRNCTTILHTQNPTIQNNGDEGVRLSCLQRSFFACSRRSLSIGKRALSPLMQERLSRSLTCSSTSGPCRACSNFASSTLCISEDPRLKLVRRKARITTAHHRLRHPAMQVYALSSATRKSSTRHIMKMCLAVCSDMEQPCR
jgi:hypothetical protein